MSSLSQVFLGHEILAQSLFFAIWRDNTANLITQALPLAISLFSGTLFDEGGEELLLVLFCVAVAFSAQAVVYRVPVNRKLRSKAGGAALLVIAYLFYSSK